MTATIRNPVLPGFHPDPSIVRVGQDYYMATSTFQWWPGVRIHHARDLAYWEPIGYALTRPSQLDMVGVPDHGGIWAPALSYDASCKLFYLIYTNVQSRPGYFDDLNYLVTAEDPAGPWSDPVYLNGCGFDPSLFHDTDGRKWYLQMTTDPRPGRKRFAGIRLQEYDPDRQCLTGPAKVIFAGTELGYVEGPHLYRRGDWYYLVTAEGGTSYEHAVTVARSRSIWGPYEVHPDNPMLTSAGDDTLALQKSGHGSLVETPDGEWWLAHLCARPLPGAQRCPLGRETALQRVVWGQDGWPRIEGGGNRPRVAWTLHGVEDVKPAEPLVQRITFPAGPLHDDLNTLRVAPDPSWLTTGEDDDCLAMVGRSSLESLRHQSLVGRRLQHFRAEATTCLRFEPEEPLQMAGMLAYYDTQLYHYLYMSRDEERGNHLAVLSSDRGRITDPTGDWLGVEGWPAIHLRVEVADGRVRFSAGEDGSHWQAIGGALDLAMLSDENATGLGGFTGAYIALAVQDLAGRSRRAVFEYLTYTGWSQG
ncbi:MAG: glycoside hydrolase family 43 protein [Planctomycetota bacterium]